MTRADGTTRTFPNEAAAEAALAGVNLEHRRGAFFEVASAAAPAPAARAEAASTSAPAKERGKK